MSSISEFDFSNEGDCIMANDSLNQCDCGQLCAEPSFTFMDLMMLSACSDLLFHDVEMDEQQMSQLKNFNDGKPKAKPFIDIIDLNESDKELVNDIKPKPAVVIGVKGEF